MPRNDLIQLRSDTAANWASVNPTLAIGETGFETDTGKLKVGTGSTAWNSLLYVTDASDLAGIIPSARISGSYTGITGVGTVTAGDIASNLLSGTITSARISGSYTGITGVGTLTGLTVDGTSSSSMTFGDWSTTPAHSGIEGNMGYLLLGKNALDNYNIYLRGNNSVGGVYIGANNTNILNVNVNGINVTGTITASSTIGFSGTTYLAPVTGGATQYGSVRVTGTPSAAFWEGYNINGNAVFMSNSTQLGLYDNSNLEWALLYTRNGSTAITFNGATKVETSNTGATTTGTHTATAFSGNGASVTTINADNISSGTLANARLPATATTITSVGTLTALAVTGNITTTTGNIEIGGNRTSNGFAFIDLIGDTTYTDYGLRILRGDGGANTVSQVIHRGTGIFTISTNESAPIIFGTTSIERVRISDTSLTQGVSTVLSANNTLQCAGLPAFAQNAWAGVSSYNFFNASDIRYKQNVKPLPLGTQFLRLLNPIEFTYLYPQFEEDNNTPTSITEGHRLRAGLSAQNVKEALEIIGTGDYNLWSLADKNNPDSFQALDYTGLVAPLIQAFKELDQRLQRLEESNV